MSTQVIHPWISINGVMNSDYRATVVEIGLDHLAEATPALADHAKRTLAQNVKIPGFRSNWVDHAPPGKCVAPVSRAFMRKNKVTSTIIALWAEAKADVILELAATGESLLSAACDSVDWEEAIQGFTSDDTLMELMDCAMQLGEGRDEVDMNHLHLAAFWLTGLQASRTIGEVDEHQVPLEATLENDDDHPNDDLAIENTEDVTLRETDMPQHKDTESSNGKGGSQLIASTSPQLPDTMPLLSLDELEDAITVQSDLTYDVYQSLLIDVAKLHDALKASNVVETTDLQAKIATNLESWRQRRKALLADLHGARTALEQAIQQRPELMDDLLPILPFPTESNEDIEPILEYVSSTMERIRQYDADRAQLAGDVVDTQLELDTIVLKLRQWLDTDDVETLEVLRFDEESLTGRSIGEIREIDSLARANLERFRVKLEQTEFANRGRLISLVKEATELKAPLEALPFGNLDDQTDVDSVVRGLTIEARKSAEYTLSRLVEDLRLKQNRQTAKLAASLRQDWSDHLCVDLIHDLVAEHRDIDACLLFLSSVEDRGSALQLNLSSEIFPALHHGMFAISQGRDVWLWSHIATKVLPYMDLSNSDADIQISLLTLAAHLAAPNRLLANILWQISNEWPRPEMQSWSVVWRAVRDGNTVTVESDRVAAQVKSDLDAARSFSEVILERQPTGLFIKASSVADRKYRRVLNSRMLPEVEKYRTKLGNLDDALMAARPVRMGKIRSAIAETAAELDKRLRGEAVKEMFEAGLAADGISNYHAFHGKKCVSILEEALSSTATYAQALLAYSDAMLSVESKVESASLRNELDSAGMLSPLVQSWIDMIEMGLRGSPIAEDAAVSELEATILEYITGQADLARRLPRLVSSMAREPFSWTTVLKRLLHDLAHPPTDAENAARILLESEAPAQALLFADELPVEVQKECIALSGELRRKYEMLRNELMKFGGDPSGITDTRIRLHMWAYAIDSITADIDQIRAQAERNRLEKDQQAMHLLAKMQSLEIEVFQHKQTMPSNAFNIIRSGLNQARDRLAESGPGDEIVRFVNEIDYRVQHKSWSSPQDLQQAVDALGAVAFGDNDSYGPSMPIDSVLQCLSDGLLADLHLPPKDLDQSKLDTRIAICRDWIFIRDNVSGFLTEDLTETDKAAITKLFSDFATMTSMKYARTFRDEPRVFSDPIMYSVFELRHPRTVALDRDCTMICLPGVKATAAIFEQLDELLEGQGWLSDGAYVFLFAPGITHDLHRRLHSDYGQRGLIVINEQVLKDLLLAEADTLIPLGRLRSLMLNARGAQNVDIFKVNQLVHARTSIFVGRDALVSKIVSSGDNYVLYGGRRIGKSSVLQEVRRQLELGKAQVVHHSFEGESDRSDRASAREIGKKLGLEIDGFDEFKPAVESYLNHDSSVRIVFLFDEIDGYITRNPERHILIESLRSLSDQFDDRLRVVAAGFVELYKCVKGQGPYSPNSDPWTRMFNDELGPLPNLRPSQAEKIVYVGFREVLGWNFESHRVPQLIVERTGGHPAFVQYFCLKLQRRVGMRDDRTIRVGDIDAVYEDVDPAGSFISHVKDTLFVNNIEDAFGQFLLLYLAVENSEASQFTFKQAEDFAELYPKITTERLKRALELLTITSVIRATAPGVFEFTVPDYPSILARLGDTHSMDELEARIMDG